MIPSSKRGSSRILLLLRSLRLLLGDLLSARGLDALQRLRLGLALALQALLRDQALHLRRLLLLARLAADNVRADVVLLLQVEGLADVRRALRPEAARLVVVRETRDVLLALLHDDELKKGE